MGIFDFHAVFYAQHPFLNFEEFITIPIFKDQSRSHAQSFSIDLEELFAAFVLNPEIISN